jgi:hypothetical protein
LSLNANPYARTNANCDDGLKIPLICHGFLQKLIQVQFLLRVMQQGKSGFDEVIFWHRGFTVKMLRSILAAGLMGLALGASAESGDVGLVNQMSGDVAYARQGGAQSKAQAFMKLRQGDSFTLPAGAQLRVVYFNGSRQETWKGPASFKTGAQQSEAISGQVAGAAQLPSGVARTIAQVPNLVQIAKLARSGGIAVRGGGKAGRLSSDQQAEISQAKATYAQMRQTAPAEDITPELFFYAVLQDHLLYVEMKPVTDEMLKRQPKSLEAQELAAYVKSRIL